MTRPGIVIVGASYAGVSAAAAARDFGYRGAITLVGEENHLPYQRPPLSKRYLKGQVEDDQLTLRAQAFYRSAEIEFMRGVRVTSVDRGSRTIGFDSGNSLAYEKLILATGSRPRSLTLRGSECKGVFHLRTLDDARELRAALARASAVAVIGGGFIGLEIAASARQMGLPVSILEAQPRLLSRSVPATLAEYIAGRHTASGARVLLGAQVDALLSDRGYLRAIALTDGTEIAADLVIVGIGVIPNVELAQAAGLECRNGIVVDRGARTLDPSIYAAGDCTTHPYAGTTSQIRLECVQNANEQGRVAGINAAGGEAEYRSVPWFWSDQHDMKLQGVGISTGHDSVAIRGDMASGAFSIFYFCGDRLIAVDSVNRPGEHMMARKLIAAAAPLSPRAAADPSFDLRAALADAG